MARAEKLRIILNAFLKATLASLEASPILKGAGTLIGELSGNYEKLNDNEKLFLTDSSQKEIQEAILKSNNYPILIQKIGNIEKLINEKIPNGILATDQFTKFTESFLISLHQLSRIEGKVDNVDKNVLEIKEIMNNSQNKTFETIWNKIVNISYSLESLTSRCASQHDLVNEAFLHYYKKAREEYFELISIQERIRIRFSKRLCRQIDILLEMLKTIIIEDMLGAHLMMKDNLNSKHSLHAEGEIFKKWKHADEAFRNDFTGLKNDIENEFRKVVVAEDPIDKEQERFLKIYSKMPKLINEMRDDLKCDELHREFLVLSDRKVVVNMDGKFFAYCQNEHEKLADRMSILINVGYIDDITETNIKKYRMTEEFVELILTADKML